MMLLGTFPFYESSADENPFRRLMRRCIDTIEQNIEGPLRNTFPGNRHGGKARTHDFAKGQIVEPNG